MTLTGMVEIKRYKGSILIFVDGKPIPSILAYVGPEYYRDFRDAGIRIVTWHVPIGWIGSNKFDYAETDQIISKFISIDSEILLIPRISFPGSNNDWWCQEYPEELVRLSNGELGSGHSSSSMVWRKEAAEALVRFIKYIEKAYTNNIIGYHICDGHFLEWFAWDSANFEKEVHNLCHVCGPGFNVENCPTPWPDYSKPMIAAFREWLYKKYGGDVSALRKAWNDPYVDFSTVMIPSRRERAFSEDFIIRNPSKTMKVIDYDTFFQDIHTDTILELCKAAKKEVGKRKLIGIFYGYTWTAFFRGFYMQNAGHVAFYKMLHSPYIDFFASPCDYENRGVEGVSFSQSIPETVTLHGKIFFNEVDPKTFLTDPSMKWHHKCDLKPQSLDETIEILKRYYSYAHAMGIGMWWTDLFGQGWYHHDGIVQALRKLKEIEKRLLEFDHSSNREVAIILDEKSLLYERPCQNLVASLRSIQRQWELAYMGTPFDTFLQSDVVDHEDRIKNYKMYLFLNNVHMTNEEAEKVKRIVSGDGKVAVWVWAPGLILNNVVSLDHIKDLTGINIKNENSEANLHVDITNYEHPITKDIPRGSGFGPAMSRWHTILFKESGFMEDDPTFTIGPIFYADDPGAITLGMISAIGKPGFVVKDFGDWISIYVSNPMLPKEVLRNIAKIAGIHVYVESGELVYANKHFLSICPRVGGKKIIRLPELSNVFDLWNNKTVASNTQRFEVDMKENEVYMYLLT